jgi:uncharacterized protein (TIGR03067 family)
MRISGTRYDTINIQGRKVSGSFQVDETKNPALWEETDDDGELKGKTRLGILRLQNNRLTICDSRPGERRPTVFDTTGTSHVLATYERIREDRGQKTDSGR